MHQNDNQYDGLPLDVVDDERINDLGLDPIKVKAWLEEVQGPKYFDKWDIDGDREPVDYQGWDKE